MSQYREMRMFVTFDLPVESKEEKREYREFRALLLDEGFIMLQYSVYARFCRNGSEYSKYVRRIRNHAPIGVGDIRIFGLTEKQYQNMYMISGKKKSDEEILGIRPLVVIE